MRDDDFERLFAQHAERLLSFLVYRTGDRALAEDLVADTFERVLKARRRYDPRRASERTWIYTIALNRLRDHMRSRQAEARAVEAVRSASEAASPGGSPVEALGEREALLAALATLADEEREALALRYGADMTVPEIAKLKGEKLTTVEGRVYRGLRKLRERLD
jgi:RNA polymerase sigma-70 factor, ECF subfamily